MPPRFSTRREFLTGRAVVERLRAAVEGDARVLDEPGATPYLVQVQRPAMACTFAVWLNAGQYPQATPAALEALDLVEALEAQLTVYRDSSEVSQINACACDEPIEVEPGLFVLLQRAVELWRETSGAYDVAAGRLTKAWGFYRRQGTIPDEAALAAAREASGSAHVTLDPTARTIRFTRPGVELNLGSIGKGYALDRCDVFLRERGVHDFLWHGGQSSVWARGSSAEQVARGGGWKVGVRHPIQPDVRLGSLILRDQALATSGASVQFFRHQGKRYGHILDPRTGWPAEGMFSTTVVAPTAAEADALATAFYVLGVEAALDYCSRRPEIGAVLVYPSADGSRVEIVWANLDDRAWCAETA